VKEVAIQEGFDSVDKLLENYGLESVMPACCEELCSVESDGTCSHGHPSILIELGMI